MPKGDNWILNCTSPLAGSQRPHLVALVRAGAVFHNGKQLERPVDITPTESGGSTETEVA